MYRYIIDMPFNEETGHILGIVTSRLILLNAGILDRDMAWISGTMNATRWRITCTEEKLTFLVLMGATIVMKRIINTSIE